ncbi:MAG: hypothetical protein QM742_14640 [Aquabacterium sp.]
MALNTNTIALISVVIGFVGIAWAVFWPVRHQPGSQPVSSHWDIVYVDDEGIMHFTLVRVIKIHPSTRRMTAWCSSTGSERVFKLGKIVKATDIRSGHRINIAWLMDRQRLMDAALTPAQPKDDQGLCLPDAGGWWSASRLGLH